MFVWGWCRCVSVGVSLDTCVVGGRARVKVGTYLFIMAFVGAVEFGGLPVSVGSCCLGVVLDVDGGHWLFVFECGWCWLVLIDNIH